MKIRSSRLRFAAAAISVAMLATACSSDSEPTNGETAGGDETLLISADGTLTDNFIELPESVGIYHSGPSTEFEGNANEITGVSASDFLTAYEEEYGEAPSAPFWAHAYDATTLLLSAIEAVAETDDEGNLVIDRQALRDELHSVSGVSGITGTLSCDEYGDCGAQQISIVEHLEGETTVADVSENLAFEYAPESASGTEGGTETATESETATEPTSEDTAGEDESPTDGDTGAAGELGTVVVPEGEPIQVRSLESISGDTAFLGLPNQRATQTAIEDYGQIEGHDVELGTPLDDLCDSAGGQSAAQTIVADDQVVGVIGTSCSGAAVAAMPLISDAGMVMISASNTSPSLTSDLAGTAGADYQPGYFRTAHNDLFQGRAVAEFVYNEQGIESAAGIHDGDPYTQGLATAFADAFEELGGTITTVTAVNKGDTDMTGVLTEVAEGDPGALFFPIFMPEAGFIAQQVSDVEGLSATDPA